MYPYAGAVGHINMRLSPLQSFRSMCVGVAYTYSPDAQNGRGVPSGNLPHTVFDLRGR